MSEQNLPQLLENNQQLQQIGDILMRAVELNIPLESLERLLTLHERVKAERARDAYYQAMADFQTMKPSIPKRYAVLNKDNSLRYRYAKMDDIADAINGPLGQCGLSYKFEMAFTVEGDKHFEVAACVVSHVAGHSERTEFKVPVEFSGGMNQIQAFGSASTYAKRYALCNAFGITPDEDDDAGSGTVTRTYTEQQGSTVRPPQAKAASAPQNTNGGIPEHDGKLTGPVVNFRSKSGKSPAKMNVQGEAISTFDDKLIGVADSCFRRNVIVDAYYKISGDYKNLVYLEAAKEQGQPKQEALEGSPI